MKTIYKYVLTGRHTTKLELPKGATVVKFDVQESNFCIWAMVDTDSPSEERYFSVVGTGWEIEDGMVYVGTVQVGLFVWHCLEHV